MTTLTYTTLANLVVGQPENVADVVDCFQKIQTILNGNVDSATNIAPLGVSTAAIAANAVTAAKIEVQQAWQTIALANFTAANLSYYKDSLGIVHFRGDPLLPASPGAGATLCTLPAGFRPGTTIHLPLVRADTGGTSTVGINIDTAGVVRATTTGLGSTVSVSFGACHFRAEN